MSQWADTPLDMIHRTCTRHRLLSHDEELTLARCIQKGGPDGLQAKDTLIRHNLKLALKVAIEYGRGCDHETVATYFQEGIIGLNRAVEKFDPAKGYKFSTYAYWWIRQGITRYKSQQSRLIRQPDHLNCKKLAVQKGIRQHIKNHQCPTTRAEMEAIATAAGLSLERLEQLRQLEGVASLDAPVGDVDTQGTLGDAIAAPENVWDGAEQGELRQLAEEVWGAISANLSPQQARALELRVIHGLGVDAIADELGIPVPTARNLLSVSRRVAKRAAAPMATRVRAVLVG